MPKVRSISPKGYDKKPRRPALTPDARENQLISYAIDLVEQRLLDGTASSQETTHFLKLASSKARLEKELLEKEIELKAAKTKQIESEEKQEEMFARAIEAMRRYKGEGSADNYDEYEE